MKKKFSGLHNANALFKGRTLFAGVAFLFLAFIMLLLRLIAPQFLLTITTPFVSVGDAASHATYFFFGGIADKASLISERDALLQETDTLSAHERVLTEQLRDMQRLLGERHSTQPGILAAVVMRPPVSPYDTFVLDAGSKGGVISGAFIAGPDGVPLGTIDSVTTDTSRATLFSAPGRTTEAWVGTNRIALTLTGEGAGTFSATVLKETKIAEGDMVSIPGSASAPIGKVSKIDSDPSSPLEDILIAPFTNPFSVTWVTISR